MHIVGRTTTSCSFSFYEAVGTKILVNSYLIILKYIFTVVQDVSWSECVSWLRVCYVSQMYLEDESCEMRRDYQMALNG